jgi:prolipoprotein diacylglyceryl transferase 2
MLWGGMLVTVFSARFLLEFLKERQVSFEEQMSLDLGQVLSIPFIFAGMLFLLFAWRVSRGNG